MELPKLRNTDLEVSALGYGAMELRGPRIWGGRPVTDQQAERILHAVLDAGINFIDTAYDYGRSETSIGRFINQRRSEYSLATKCGCTVVDAGDHEERGQGGRSRWALWEKANLDELRGFGESRTAFLLRYTLSHPDLHTTIVGTLDPTHLAEDVAAAGVGRLPPNLYAEATCRLAAAGSRPLQP